MTEKELRTAITKAVTEGVKQHNARVTAQIEALNKRIEDLSPTNGETAVVKRANRAPKTLQDFPPEAVEEVLTDLLASDDMGQRRPLTELEKMVLMRELLKVQQAPRRNEHVIQRFGDGHAVRNGAVKRPGRRG